MRHSTSRNTLVHQQRTTRRTPEPTRVYQRDGSGTPQHTRVHSGTPVEQPTQAHPGVPMPDEIAVRLPSLPASAIANGC